MTPADLYAAQAADLIACHGEPVTLSTEAVVMGIFDRLGGPKSPWQEVGAPVRLSIQPNPQVQLREGDAAGLARGDRLVISGAAWLVVDLDPAVHGLVRVSLRPEPGDAQQPDATARWK